MGYSGSRDFLSGLASHIAREKKKQVKNIMKQEGGKIGKKYNKWGKTNEGKLWKGLVGGYMTHRKQINKGLNKISFAG